MLHGVPGIGHKRRQHLLGYETPSLSADGMRQDGRRRHSPRPFCFGGDVGVDSPRIAHVVDATAEEGLDWRPEVEGNHAGCYRPHTCRLHSSCWSLVWVLRALGGAIATGIVAGNDSRAGTGAGRHCIAWEGTMYCRCIGGRSLWVFGVGECCARGDVTSGSAICVSDRKSSQAAILGIVIEPQPRSREQGKVE